MLKKFILTLIIFIGMSAYGADNYLNSIVFEQNDGGLEIVLRSDKITKLKREVEGTNRVILTLKNIKQASDINTLYKNVNDVNGLAVQSKNNDLKIFIDAPDISKANIVFETPNSAPITVRDKTSDSKTIWSFISLGLLLTVMYSARSVNLEPKQKDINEIIKEREMALYRNFQNEIATLPSMNYKLKSYRKHVLKGETLRSYESRLSRI